MQQAQYVLRQSDVHDRPDRVCVQQVDPSWRCRVLVVDDDDLVRAQLVRLLKRSGYHVRGAASGEQALSALESDDCEMMLTDWQMPDMSGIELCRAVRRGRTHNDVYMMMLTVRDGDQDRLLALAAGADDYVVKGAPIGQILALLDAARRIAPLRRAPRRKPARIAAIGWPVIEGIDTADARGRWCDDRELFRSMLQRFLDEFADIALYAAQDAPLGAAAQAARLHKLRGGAGVLGCKAIQRAAAAAEEACEAREVERCKVLCLNLASQLEQLRHSASMVFEATPCGP
jgi:CheY-like chemotaxis protein/HPt (histidine-containing phosphotransfer) domain-containing protein